MRALVILLVCLIRNRFRSVAEIEAENVALRQQLNVILRTAPKFRLRATDRALFVLLNRLFPSVLDAIAIVKPDTVPLASRRFPRAVALEVASQRRAAKDRCRTAHVDPSDVSRESVVGSTAHPWRAAEARVRCFPSNDLALHRHVTAQPRSNVEDVPAQSRRWHGID